MERGEVDIDFHPSQLCIHTVNSIEGEEMNGNSMCTPSSRGRQVNVQPIATMEMSGVALPPPPTCQHRSRPAKVGRTPQRNNTLAVLQCCVYMCGQRDSDKIDYDRDHILIWKYFLGCDNNPF